VAWVLGLKSFIPRLVPAMIRIELPLGAPG
jgi:hypothetical protein